MTAGEPSAAVAGVPGADAVAGAGEPGAVRPTELLRRAARRLADAGVASPEADAAVLLSHLLGVERSRLPLQPDLAIDRQRAYEDLVDRRAQRVPLQHLTGSAPFRRGELAVGPGVFVPRPETELLAGWAVEQAHAAADRGGTPVVVDLCTGSGAIAWAVATEEPRSRVHAVDLDEPALVWAARNLAGTGVDLRSGDLAEAFGDLDGTVDVVVCNPPYIPLDAWESVEVEVRDHDPALALWSGADGLDAIRAVERAASRLLRHGGRLGIEHADVQGESAPGVLLAAGRWSDVRDHVDLAGRPRFVTARLAR